MILDRVSSPKDLKSLSIEELHILCTELRSEIIRITTNKGGHLGSNLGIVELTVALHFVFDSPSDKFVFDVGHQSYAHKLLTGRRDLMEKLREKDGASGFPDPAESEFDAFIAGHASTALSAALGMAKARDLSKQNHQIISLIGDGSMSGGMIFEALNNLGNTKKFIIVLNDNQMSISKTVGSIRKHLSKLLTSKRMLKARRTISQFLNKLPARFAEAIERILKYPLALFKDGTLFENFGIQYIGILDGHDLDSLIKTFQNIKECGGRKPVLVHVLTEKGKGYEPAEQDIYKLHGVSEKPTNVPTFTSVFKEEIVKLAERNEKIVCITAAMASGCGLSDFALKFPDRFFDVGIAEEHAVTFAAGLAISGFIPFVCLYSTFLQRAFDQIYHDVILQNLPVKFIVDKAGLPGKDGKTHSGIYDIALFALFPNVYLFAPSNNLELKEALQIVASDFSGPSVIRFPKTFIPSWKPSIGHFSKLLILTAGEFSESLQNMDDVDVISVFQLFPIDLRRIAPLLQKYEKIIIMEEGVAGGFAANLLDLLLKEKQFDLLKKIQTRNIPKTFTSHASRAEQLKEAGLLLDSLETLRS